MVEDLEINLEDNSELKDEGVGNIVKGIPIHNHLKRLHLGFEYCELSSKSGVSFGKLFGKLTRIEDLEVYLSMNDEFKDEGVKNTVQGITTHNHLTRLCLDFENCNLSSKSGVSTGKLFGKLTRVEDLEVDISFNVEFKDQGVKKVV